MQNSKFCLKMTPQSLEQAILDKLGEKSIKWEDLGVSYDDKKNRITYEEVINDTRPLQTQKGPWS